jgi:transcriptional regulator with GAF, ATPase, and Fis domain
MSVEAPAPDSNPDGETIKIRVDRQALLAIARNPAILLALEQTSFSINQIYITDLLLERLLDRIFALTGAERGAVLFAVPDSDELEPAAYRGSQPKIDSEIAHESFRDEVGIATRRNGHSILCVPLRVFDTVLGIIYIDSPRAGIFQTTYHVLLLIAIGSISAIFLQHTRYNGHLERENERLLQQIVRYRGAVPDDPPYGIVGESAAVQEIHHFIRKVAPSDATALIVGDSGTGKELVARAIHDNSPRKDRPYVEVNCAAFVETLIESELFGHEKGAFTGASAMKIGKLEAAHGGTLFLDEVGELSMPMQAALLRVLENRTFHRVGGTRPITVDVRLVAATNRNLEQQIKEGRFRQDLFFRLQVVVLHMPSLAQRREDIPLLAAHFLKKLREFRVVSGFSTEARRLLMAHDWQGNIRELKNAIASALVMGNSEMIQARDLPNSITRTKLSAPLPKGGLHAADNEFRRSFIQQALLEAEGNIAEAARLCELSPSYFRRLAKSLNVDLQ